MRLRPNNMNQMNNDRNPLISIITVTYNAVTVLEETILSVINQTNANIEYIVIDGGSTDGTLDIIKKYQDKISYWVSESDKGIYDAMNNGIEKATGNYINFMNAGDKFYNNSVIKSIVEYLSKRDIDVLYGNVLLRDQKKIGKVYSLKKIKTHMPFCHQSCFVKSKLHKLFQFDLAYKYTSDYKFFYDLYIQGYIFEYINDIIAVYDEQGVSTINHKECMKEYAKVRGDFGTIKFKIYYYTVLSYLKLKRIFK